MKVLFVISAYGGTASGGHYNSLNQVSLEMAANCEVKVIMLGKLMSPILKDSPFMEEHIQIGYSINDVLKLNKYLQKLFRTFKPDIIHCFDTRSLNLLLLTVASIRIPIVMNKCGGPNPKRRRYQHSDATVVFSSENHEWYLNSGRYKNDSIFCIPNRVRAIKLLPENLRIEKANPNKVTFLRVSRLGGAYEMTLLQTFNLLDKLRQYVDVELFVVGRIQDVHRFELLRGKAEEMNFDIKFITDKRASKGSDFLYLADFAIGTGRSFMEATSLGIPSLTPAKNTSSPILVNSKNVEKFLNTNFSERNISSEDEECESMENIIQAIKHKKSYEYLKRDTKSLFNEHFATGTINEKYNKVYEYASHVPLSRLNLLRLNFLYIIRFMLKGV